MSTARVSRDRLDRELACRGWTGSDLARAAGLSAATISAARRGGRVAPRTLRKIVEALLKAPVLAGAEELLDPIPLPERPSSAQVSAESTLMRAS